MVVRQGPDRDERLLVEGERTSSVSCSQLEVAHLDQTDREVPLPFGVVGIAAGQCPSDPEVLRVSGLRARDVSDHEPAIAHLDEAGCDVVQPLHVVGIATRQRPQQAETFLVGRESGRR